MKKHITSGLLAVAALMLTSAASKAAFYHVDINTAPLVGSSSAPFYLDFQFATGSGTVGNNTISLSNFTFTGGSALGLATIVDNAAGDLFSAVTIHDSAVPSELFQQFASTTTHIGFDVSSTLNVDAGLTPDKFSVAILDSSLGSPAQIYTTSPDTLALLTQTIDSASVLDVTGYHGVGPADGSASGSFAAVEAVPVPEPATMSVGLALGVVGLARRSRRARVA